MTEYFVCNDCRSLDFNTLCRFAVVVVVNKEMDIRLHTAATP